jgi:PAS domain S-box-containing protein
MTHYQLGNNLDQNAGFRHKSENMARKAPRKVAPPELDPVLEDVFDLLPDTVFFTKDAAGRYTAANRTLATRCGFKSKREILGRRVGELFPAPLAERYAAQDLQVLREGRRIVRRLELHVYPDGRRGWCLTSKFPLRRNGRIVGLAGISRDIGSPDDEHAIPDSLVAAIEHIQEHFDRRVTIGDLASMARVTPYRFSRMVGQIFGITPGQLLIQTRIEAAATRLRETGDSAARIAQACGFGDQSAFTRRFKAVTGLAPLAYRKASAAVTPWTEAAEAASR